MGKPTLSALLILEGLRLSSDGMAVGYHEGKATFVPGLLPGEIGQVQIVEEKKNWQREKLLGILKASERPGHSALKHKE